MAHIAAKPVMTIKAILNTGVVSTATPVKSRAASALSQAIIVTVVTTAVPAAAFFVNKALRKDLTPDLILFHIFKLITPFHKVKIKQHI
jgi:hypothetical protein